MVLAFVGKQAGCWVSFSREFNVLIQFFVSGVTWSVRASSVALGWKHVISLEAAAWRHGKALLSSAVVEFVVLWCYGPSILWIRLDGWFSRCQGQSPADWLSGRPCTEAMKGRSKGESANRKREFRSTRESERTLARCFKTVRFGHCPQVAGRIRVSVWGGAPPMSRLSGVDVQVIQYFIHSVEDTNLQIVYMFSHTWC